MRAAVKRTELVACRFTEKELEQLKAEGEAAEMTVSEFVRQCVRHVLGLPNMVQHKDLLVKLIEASHKELEAEFKVYEEQKAAKAAELIAKKQKRQPLNKKGAK